MIEIREVLRAWLEGAGLRTVAERAGVDRKTARRYVEAAQAAGLERSAGVGAVDDELIGAVVTAVRPARRNGHGQAWQDLLTWEGRIRGWVKGEGTGNGKGLSIVKIHELLARQGAVVPYRTLHRFATERCGYRVKDTTVRVNDGEPGVELQVDFGQMGYLLDPDDGRRRKVHALIFTAVFSRHMFVWLSHSQTLEAVLAGAEAAWAYFGGVFRVLIPDNLKPVVTDADAVNPTFSTGWLDYAQHAGFATDPARIRSPKDKPRVERTVQYVRGNFWAGEHFVDLADAQARAEAWCTDRAGMRMHGTIAARPLEVFTEHEAGALLPVAGVYDVPVFRRVKVHRDFHVEIAKALYSAPGTYLGQYLDARADSELVKLYHRGQLVKTHPRQRPGGRHTDKDDLPAEKSAYAMRDMTAQVTRAASHGPNIGIYAERVLDNPLPWTKMRSVYRLLKLVDRYGAEAVETACSRALDLDVISVAKIASMLQRATEQTTPLLPRDAAVPPGRFARDPGEFTTRPASSATAYAAEQTPAATDGTAVASEPAAVATGGTTVASEPAALAGHGTTAGITPATGGTAAASEPAAPAGRTGTLTLIRGGEPVATYCAIELDEQEPR